MRNTGKDYWLLFQPLILGSCGRRAAIVPLSPIPGKPIPELEGPLTQRYDGMR